MKAVFLDKQGALVDDFACNGQRRLSLRAGAGPALRLLARLDYRFFAVSDQETGDDGRIDEDMMARVAHRLGDLLFRERLTLEGFYYCPHDRFAPAPRNGLECFCRKPQPGMLLKAAMEHEIDLRASWMIGASLHDVEAGNRAGCRTVLIDNGTEIEWRLGPRRVPTRIAPDLYAAARLISIEGEERH
jgi:histidinol-phosphate phosphatase family protein